MGLFNDRTTPSQVKNVVSVRMALGMRCDTSKKFTGEGPRFHSFSYRLIMPNATMSHFNCESGPCPLACIDAIIVPS